MVLLSFDFPRNRPSTSNTHIPALCVILQTIPFSRLYNSPDYTVLQSIIVQTIPFDRRLLQRQPPQQRQRRWANSEAPSARCAVARTLHQSSPMAQSPLLRHRSKKSQKARWRRPARRPRKSQKSRSRLPACRPGPPALLPRPMNLSRKYRRNPNPLSASQPSIKLPVPLLPQRQQQQQRQQ